MTITVPALHLRINGRPQVIEGPVTVAELLQRLGQGPRSVAVAVNERFVPRAEHAAWQLADGDRVTCVQPIVGG